MAQTRIGRPRRRPGRARSVVSLATAVERLEDRTLLSPRPLIAGDYNFNGKLTHVEQTADDQLTFINERGARSSGVFLSDTEVQATDWGNLKGTLSNGDIAWSNGGIWFKTPVPTQVPNIAGDYIFNGQATHVEQVGTSLTFINEHGNASAGTFSDNNTKVVATDWGGLIGTLSNGDIVWANGGVWFKAGQSFPNIAGDYTFNGQATRIEQTENDLLTFFNEHGNSSSGHFMGTTQVVADGWGGLVGMLQEDGSIMWGNGSLWEKGLPTTEFPDISGDYLFNGQPTRVEQTPANELTFFNEHGNSSPGVFTSTTEVQATAWGGLTGTLGTDSIAWANGGIWFKAPATATPVYLEQIQPDFGAPLQNGDIIHQVPTELTFQFTSGVSINPNSLDGIRIIRSGLDGTFGNGNDVVITPASRSIGIFPNEVRVEFAGTLPDDVYQITIFGAGPTPLRSLAGAVFNDGVNVNRLFLLNHDAQEIIAVDTPADNSNQITVHFRNELDAATAVDPKFYTLVNTKGTADTADDAVQAPTNVTYDAAAKTALLEFESVIPAGSFELQIGAANLSGGDPLQVAPSTDDDSSFETASYIGAFPDNGLVISSQIESQDLTPPPPQTGIASTVYYNFQSVYGADEYGNALINLVTEQEQARAREVFEVYGFYLGVDFVETPDQGITVVTGDMRAVDPALEVGPGGAKGASTGGLDGLVVIDVGDGLGSEAGGEWFQTALNQIGSNLTNAGFDLAPLNPFLTGDETLAQIRRGNSSDIDLYAFNLASPGTLSADVFAQRLGTSDLDPALTLFGPYGDAIIVADDVNGQDAAFELPLQAGTYYIGVTSTGNLGYNPADSDSGTGGTTLGDYELHLNFAPQVLATATGTAIDADVDGVPGGIFEFQWQTRPEIAGDYSMRGVHQEQPDLPDGTRVRELSNSLLLSTVSVEQDGDSLTFVNEQGQRSAGVFRSPTQVVATGWGNLLGTLTDNGIAWSNGATWYRVHSSSVSSPGNADPIDASTFQLVQVLPNIDGALQDGDVRHTAPNELVFRFSPGQAIDANSLGGISIIRSGLDGTFNDGNEVTVKPGWVGIGDHPYEVIFRFAENLPDDSYQITIAGAGGPELNIPGQNFTGVAPPDPVGDVGINYYIQAVNGAAGSVFTIYNKSDGSVAMLSDGVTPAQSIPFTSLDPAGATSLSDPIVLYDQEANRWLLGDIADFNTLNVFISQTDNVTDNLWFHYTVTTPDLPDYPKFAVWNDAYYVTTNEADTTTFEPTPAVYALDRANMLANGTVRDPVRMTATGLAGFAFQAFTPADVDGAPPVDGEPAFFMRHVDDEAHNPGASDLSNDFLEVWEFNVDFDTPANSTFAQVANIPISEFDSDLNGLTAFSAFPQPGTSIQLDPIREVIMNRLQYRDFGSYQTLVGNFVTDVDETDHGGVRWFELRKDGTGDWDLYQEGDIAPDGTNRWLGAIAMDGNGNIAVGYNVTSTMVSPGIRYTGRMATDPLGTMLDERVLVDGAGFSTSNRWGDYSAMSVDPVDDSTFWYTGEYTNGTGTWSTRIGAFTLESLRLPEPLRSTSGAVFNGGVDQVIHFNLDLGAQVVAVDPQPVLRDQLINVAIAASVADGDTISVTVRGQTVVFELNDLNVDNVVAQGHAQVDFTGGVDTAQNIASVIALAIGGVDGVSAAPNGSTVTVQGDSFNPIVSVASSTAGALTRSEGGLVQRNDQIVVHFNEDTLDQTSAETPAFYQLINTQETLDHVDDAVVNPTGVDYDPATNTAVLTFADPLQAGSFRLRIGVSDQPSTSVVSVSVDALNLSGLSLTSTVSAQPPTSFPPDTMGAVGRNHIIETINNNIEVFNKSTGGSIFSISDEAFWTGLGVSYSNDTFDPRVIYDPTIDRFIIAEIDRGVGNSILIAISDSSDISNPTAWTGFSFQADSGGTTFNDFDMLGVDADGVYVSTNNFDASDVFQNVSLYVLPKADLLSGSIANLSRFEDLNAATVGTSPQPVVDFGPDDNRAVFLSANGGQIIRTNIDTTVPNNPVLQGSVVISGVPGYSAAPDARQPGPDDNIEIVSPRFNSNVVQVGGSFWAVHAVLDPTFGGSAIRWYKINAATNSVVQTGLIHDADLDFYDASIAVNAAGDVVIGFSGSGDAQPVSSYAVGGVTSGGVTTFGVPQVLKQGTGQYFADAGTGRNRWGDYSATVVDPDDPSTFWTFQEFAAGDNQFGIQVTELTTNSNFSSFNDANSSFATASDLGGLGAGEIVINARIQPQPIALPPLPGGTDEPGHREIPVESHFDSTGTDPVLPGDIQTVYYNFLDEYGTDPDGNTLFNEINEDQKQRTREIFELLSHYLGIEAVETEDRGLIVVTGDLRAVSPTVPTGPGGVVGISEGSIADGARVIMDNADFTNPADDMYGGPWFRTALHEISHSLGLGHSTDQVSVNAGFGIDLSKVEPVFTGDVDFEHLMRLWRPDATDIDLYRFQLVESGLFTAETFAERLSTPSLLNSALSLFRSAETPLQQPVTAAPGPVSLTVADAGALKIHVGDTLRIGDEEFSVTGLSGNTITADRAANGTMPAGHMADDLVFNLTRGSVVARNDDYYSNDSYLELTLDPGMYFVGVTSTGNLDYNPEAPDTGSGGTTDGQYQLRLNFQPTPQAGEYLVDMDASGGTAFDGDADGKPGGTFDFWFQATNPTQSNTIYVDKASTAAGTPDGSLARPFKTIKDAIDRANVRNNTTDTDIKNDVRDAMIIRIVGNGGTDGDLSTSDDANPYLIGVDDGGGTLVDGKTFVVPKGVTVMIDQGAVIKLQKANIDVGSSSVLVNRHNAALQVLGTPDNRVVLTSFGDDEHAIKTDSPSADGANRGDWGGVVFRADSDIEEAGVFLNSVYQADIYYGGGQVNVDSVLGVYSPIHIAGARPAVAFNNISLSADAAVSANLASFEDTIRSGFVLDIPLGPGQGGLISDGDTLTITDNTGLTKVFEFNSVGGVTPGRVPINFLMTDTRDVLIGKVISTVNNLFGFNAVMVQRPGSGRIDVTAILAISEVSDGMAVLDRYDRDATLARIGPDIHGNLLSANSLNGLFINVPTPFGVPTDVIDVGARFDDTDITHIITENVMIDGAAGGPQIFGGVMIARESGRLRIDANTVVKLDGARIEAGVGNANLIVEGDRGTAGTNEQNVNFTSIFDDEFGRGGTFDTNDDDALMGNESVAKAGDWGGVMLNATSQGSIDQSRIEFGGGIVPIEGTFDGFNVIEATQADFRLANSRLQGNAANVSTTNRNGRGTNDATTVFIRGAQPVIVGNVFLNNEGAVASINANSFNAVSVRDLGRSTGFVDAVSDPESGDLLFNDNTGPLVRLNRFTNNAINGLVVRGEHLTTESIWDDVDIVHVLMDEITIDNFHTFGGLRLESAPTESLVVKLQGANAGITANGNGLDIIDRIGGTLQVVGQPLYPVVLTSFLDDTVGAGLDFDGLPQYDTNNDGVPGSVIGTVLPSPGIPFTVTPTTDANAIVGAMLLQSLPSGVSISSSTLVTGQVGSGIYDGGDTVPLQIPLRGAILSTGNAVLPNSNTAPDWDFTGGIMGTPGDADLDALIPGTTTEATVLTVTIEVDPTSGIQSGSFLFQFGSDEYSEFVGTGFNDVVGAFINGGAPTNFLRDSLGNLVSINSALFDIDNESSPTLNIEYDGMTGGLLAQFPLQPGTNTLKIAIGDVLDEIYDSGILLTDLQFSTQGVGTGGISSAALPSPGEWRSLDLQAFSNDRNVVVANEIEPAALPDGDVNNIPDNAQFLGELSVTEKSADENRRAGFEVHGFISRNNPGDVDIYSFDAFAGTEVWLDLDRTDPALNTVMELVDPLGNVLAQSINNDVLSGLAFPLTKDVLLGGDYYTSNPNDAGMRVVLPGAPNTLTTYYVRVHSFDVTGDGAGDTNGEYQLQIRLRQQDEHPGSTVRSADVRYATNGIRVLGVPAHSPLGGDTADREMSGGTTNGSIANSQDVGNLLDSDRASIAIAGLLNTFGDLDFYQFEVHYEDVQTIAGFSNLNRSAATIFDIDYADGLARANSVLNIYRLNLDGTISLAFTATDSNVGEDRPAPLEGGDFDDLSRGSVGALDPYIGAVSLREGTYWAVVSSNAMVPDVLEQFFTPVTAHAATRLQPVDSLVRVVDGNSVDETGDPFINPINPFNDQTSSIVPFHLGDIVLFVSQDAGNTTTVVTVDPFTGQRETIVNAGGGIAGLGSVHDIALDGLNLVGLTFNPIGIQRSDGNTGHLISIDTGTGAFSDGNDDGIETYELDPTQNPPAVVRSNANGSNGPGVGINFEAIVSTDGVNTGNLPADVVNGYFAVGNRSDANQNPPGVSILRNILYWISPTGVAQSDPANDRTTNQLPGGAGTQIRERGELDTFLGSTVTIVDPTIIDPTQPLASDLGTIFNIRDGVSFTVNFGGGSRTYELDSGIDTRLLVDPDASRIQAVPFGSLVDGTTFAITASGLAITDTYEIDTDGNLLGLGIPVSVPVGSTASQVATIITSAINTGATNGATATAFGDRIALAGTLLTFNPQTSGLGFAPPQIIGDGSFFLLDGDVARSATGRPREIFQFDIGNVFEVEDGELIRDGDTITITDQASSVPVTFEFDNDNAITPGFVQVPFTSLQNSDTVIANLISIANGLGFGFQLSQTPSTNRVSAAGASNVTETSADGVTVVADVGMSPIVRFASALSLGGDGSTFDVTTRAGTVTFEVDFTPAGTASFTAGNVPVQLSAFQNAATAAQIVADTINSIDRVGIQSISGGGIQDAEVFAIRTSTGTAYFEMDSDGNVSGAADDVINFTAGQNSVQIANAIAAVVNADVAGIGATADVVGDRVLFNGDNVVVLATGIHALDESALTDGDLFEITTDQGTDTYEIDIDGSGVTTGFAVSINTGDTAADVAAAIAASINLNQTNGASAVAIGDHVVLDGTNVIYNNAVSITPMPGNTLLRTERFGATGTAQGDKVVMSAANIAFAPGAVNPVVNVTEITDTSFDPDAGGPLPSTRVNLIRIAETDQADFVGQAIATRVLSAIAATPSSATFVTTDVGNEGGRVNFLDASAFQSSVFSAFAPGTSLMVHEDDKTPGGVLSTSGAAGAAVAVPFRAQDTEIDIAIALQALMTQNPVGISPAVPAGTLRGRNGATLDLDARVTGDPPLIIVTDSGTEGIITGITTVDLDPEDGDGDRIMYAVSDQGFLYIVNNPNGTGSASLTLVGEVGGPGTGIEFSGLTTMPQRVEDVGLRGRYFGTLMGVDRSGRLYAFDTNGNFFPAFVDGNSFLDTNLANASGLAFSDLQENVWSVGGGTFSTGNYNFAGGARGSVESSLFSLKGYSAADQPTLYFDYNVATENVSGRDSLRAFISNDSGVWTPLATNNGPRQQPLFDSQGNRQVRIDLSAFAGQSNLKLRFDFNTAGDMNTGDASTIGYELRALPGFSLRDGQTFDIDGTPFEFEQGITIVAPTGAGINDGETLSVIYDDGGPTTVVFEFDKLGNGFNNGGDVLVSVSDTDTAERVAQKVRDAIANNTGGFVDPIKPDLLNYPNHTEMPELTNRINVIGATLVTSTNAALSSDLEGAVGLNDPNAVPVVIDASMERQDLGGRTEPFTGSNIPNVRDAIRIAIADTFAIGGNFGVIGELEPNDAAVPFFLAQDVRAREFWSLLRVDTIGDVTNTGTSQTIPHISIDGTGDGTYDYFRFDINGANAGNPVEAIFDIDLANIDTALYLYASDGTLVATNDNSNVLGFNAPGFGTIAGTLPAVDSGSPGLGFLDPFLQYNFTQDDTYILGVARTGAVGDPGGIAPGFELQAGDQYTLHMSIEDHPNLFSGSLNENEPNDTINGAQNVDNPNDWTLFQNNDITDASGAPISTTTPHTSITGRGSNFNQTFDYFSFTVTGASALTPVRGVIDVDDAFNNFNNFNAEVFLYDSAGNLVADNDDGDMIGFSDPTYGMISGVLAGADTGSQNTLDPFLQFDFIQDGTYIVGIAEFDSQGDPGGITGNRPERFDTYTLNISLEGHPTNFTGSAGGLVDAIKVYKEVVRVIGHNVIDAGPLGLTDGMPGDGTGFNNKTRGQNNNFAGATIRNIIIGFAERGELVTGATPNATAYRINPLSVPGITTDILVGDYQLEIRRTNEFTAFSNDTNDRLAAQITLVAPAGVDIFDGQTFQLSNTYKDSTENPVVTFEYVDLEVPGAGADPDHFPIFFRTSDSAATIAALIRNAINSTQVHNVLNARASLSDGAGTGFGSTSNLVNVYGNPAGDADGSLNFGGITAIVYDNYGDQNLERRAEQGVINISGNQISHVAEYGIVVDTDQRDAGSNLSHPGAPRTLLTLNNQRLVPATVIQNNVVSFFGTGGILFSGDANAGNVANAVIPFGKIFNNTVYGGQSQSGTGIEVTENASPTILNNIVANTVDAITIDNSSRTAGTVVGTTVFQNNGDDTIRPAIEQGTNAINLLPAQALFVDPLAGNFYLASGSRAIDSSLNRLADRPAIAGVKSPLGILPSDIFAPDYDVFGQLRVDDPLQSPPPGLGFQVFKDRGAVERADFVGPTSQLIVPLDNGPRDFDSDLTEVLTTVIPSQFVVKLFDVGIGINDVAIQPNQFELRRDGTLLRNGIDYQFVYNANSDEVTFRSTLGPFPLGVYTLTIDNTNAATDGVNGVRDLAGLYLQPNQPNGTVQYTIALGSELSIDDVTVTEGNAPNTVDATFTVTLSGPSETPVMVDVATADGTATTADNDYVENMTTLTFAPGGPLTQTFTVTVNGDDLGEPDETFFVNLTNVVNARIRDGQGVGTIENDDPPAISIDDVTVVEPDVGATGFAVFTVSLSNAGDNPVTVDYVTVADTATAGQDYFTKFGTLTFDVGGPLSQQVMVQIIGDSVPEGLETFFVNLFNPTNSTLLDGQGVGTISDVEKPLISINDASELEGNVGASNFVVFTVTMSQASTREIRVNYATANNTTSDTATAGSDYTAKSGTLVFSVGGALSQQILVPIQADDVVEPNETFFVNLQTSNASLFDGQGIGTIINDDGGAPRLAAGTGGSASASPLQPSQLDGLVSQAIATWNGVVGLPAVNGTLQSVSFQVEDLPGSLLGLASTAANTVSIDTNAAGYGWFVDATPAENEEFTFNAATGQFEALPGPAAGAIDLYTVVLHELGHILGLDDLDATAVPNDLMTETQAVGIRQLPNASHAALVNDQLSATGSIPVVPLWDFPASEGGIDTTAGDFWTAPQLPGVLPALASSSSSGLPGVSDDGLASAAGNGLWAERPGDEYSPLDVDSLHDLWSDPNTMHDLLSAV